MAKQMAPLDVMNLLGKAADNKSRTNVNPEDEEDPLNSTQPKAAKGPASTKTKQNAAIKEQYAGKGKEVPNKNSG
jgi:hypothetical protein